MSVDSGDVALVVDLDGTLIKTDLLIESAFVAVREQPSTLLRMPGWLRDSKATLKARIAGRVSLDVVHMPYNEEVVELLATEKARGRRLVLATAANRRYARAVADHLGLFDDVLSSDERTNLSRDNKLAAIRACLGDGAFDYVADHDDDRVIWAAAREAIMVGTNDRTRAAVEKQATDSRYIARERPGPGTWIRAMRLYQWSKNILIFVPLLASHQLSSGPAVAAAVLAFFAYGALASSVYLLNDLADLADDRRHPNKRRRPFASGALPLLHGLVAVPVLLVIAALLCLFLPAEFALVLAAYYGLTLAYSFSFKRIALVDVLSLAALYTLRLIAGGVATGIHLSVWLMALSMSLFLSLALAKRCTELLLVRSGHTASLGRGYAESDIETLKSLGTAAGYTAVVVLALYINSPEIRENYSHPTLVWLLCPVVIYWVSRIWLKTMRGEMTDDPIVFAARDRASQLCILAGLAVVVAAI